MNNKSINRLAMIGIVLGIVFILIINFYSKHR